MKIIIPVSREWKMSARKYKRDTFWRKEYRNKIVCVRVRNLSAYNKKIRWLIFQIVVTEKNNVIKYGSRNIGLELCSKNEVLIMIKERLTSIIRFVL